MQSDRSVASPGSLPWHPGVFVLIGLLTGCGGGDGDPAVPDVNQVTCPSNWGTAAFFRTATTAHIAACVEAGENVRARSPDTGETPLHLAGSYSDDPTVIRALIEAGAGPGSRNNDDQTVLCVAVVRNENPAVIQALLDGGSQTSDLCRSPGDPRGVSPGITPLHLAARSSPNPAVAEVLIRAGADVNAEGGRGEQIPLFHAAAYNDNPAMVELLLRSGSELRWVAQYAARNENAEILRILIAAGAGLSGALHRAVFNTNVTITEILIDAGADLDEGGVLETGIGESTEGATPLHFAAYQGQQPTVVNLAAVEMLLQAGADPNIRDASGRTPLDWAESAGGRASVAELLRRYGGQTGG